MDYKVYINQLDIKKSWKTILKKCMTQEEYNKIKSNIFSHKYYPNKENIFEVFKSYFVIFTNYDFGRYILTSSYVSIGTVAITLLFSIIFFTILEAKTFIS